MKYALIIDGQVAQIFDERPELHEDLMLVECPDDTQAGDVYEDGGFTRPVAARAVFTGAALANEIRLEARRRILNIAPEWKQANLTARAAELALLYPNVRGEDLPEPERTEYLAGQAIWDLIKTIRAASNAIEAAEAALTFDEIRNHPLWP